MLCWRWNSAYAADDGYAVEGGKANGTSRRDEYLSRSAGMAMDMTMSLGSSKAKDQHGPSGLQHDRLEKMGRHDSR